LTPVSAETVVLANPGWPALVIGSWPVCPPGADQIVAFVQLGQELGQFGGVVLEVGVPW